MVDERYIIVGLGPRLRGCAAPARHHLHRFEEQRDRGRRRRGPVRGRCPACVTSTVPTAVNAWRSRTRCACRAEAAGFLARRHGSAGYRVGGGQRARRRRRLQRVPAVRESASGRMQLARREGAGRQTAVQVVRADPDPPQRERHQGDGGIRGRREGQAPADRRTVRAEAADRGPRRGPAVRLGV